MKNKFDLTADSLININNIRTCLNNITLRKFNVKPYGYDEMYMDKNFIEDKLYLQLDSNPKPLSL